MSTKRMKINQKFTNMMTKLFLVSIPFLCGSGAMAKSGIQFFGGAFFDKGALDSDLNTENLVYETSSQNFALNIGGGYTFDIGLYLGVKYLDYSNTQKIAISGETEITSPSQTVKSVFSAPGLSVGFVADKGFFIVGSALLSPEQTVETTTIQGTETSYAKSVVTGSFGYMADVGFTYHMTPTFGLGPQISYYAAKFNKHASVADGASTKGDLKNYQESKIVPFISMSLRF